MLVMMATRSALHARTSLRTSRGLYYSTTTLKMTALQDWSGREIPFKKAYELAAEYLQESGADEAYTSARYLVSDVASVGMRYSDFRAAVGGDMVLSKEQMAKLKIYVEKRSENMPVQYILGNWDFYGLTIECQEPVLIPRPETEELVERILLAKVIPDGGRILDIGAGTGAIGVTLLHHLPGSTCEALDINEVAVTLANRNAASILGDNEAMKRYQCSLTSFEDYAASSISAGGGGGGGFDVIVSNPPYIPSDEMEVLMPEVKDYEDHRALHGGDDGLDLVRHILRQGPALLRPDGPRELWMEVARRHPKAIQELVEQEKEGDTAHGPRFKFLEGINDLSGNPRFVRLGVE